MPKTKRSNSLLTENNLSTREVIINDLGISLLERGVSQRPDRKG